MNFPLLNSPTEFRRHSFFDHNTIIDSNRFALLNEPASFPKDLPHNLSYAQIAARNPRNKALERLREQKRMINRQQGTQNTLGTFRNQSSPRFSAQGRGFNFAFGSEGKKFGNGLKDEHLRLLVNPNGRSITYNNTPNNTNTNTNNNNNNLARADVSASSSSPLFSSSISHSIPESSRDPTDIRAQELALPPNTNMNSQTTKDYAQSTVSSDFQLNKDPIREFLLNNLAEILAPLTNQICNLIYANIQRKISLPTVNVNSNAPPQAQPHFQSSSYSDLDPDYNSSLCCTDSLP